MKFTAFLREQKSDYQDWERQIQRLLKSFFDEFLASFFPKLYKRIDPQSIVSLPSPYPDKDFPLFVVKDGGEDTLIFVHIESGHTPCCTISKRMCQLFIRLQRIYQIPIIPIFLPLGEGCSEKERYKVSLPMIDFLDFHYYVAEVQKKNWREYIQNNNVIAAALLNQMEYSEREKLELQMGIFKMLIRIHGNKDEDRLLYNYFTD